MKKGSGVVATIALQMDKQEGECVGGTMVFSSRKPRNPKP